MQDVLDGYAAAATPAFIEGYDTLSTERIYQLVIDLFPQRAARVADIGAGTGRDAAWFAERGNDVVAVEPVRQLREAGQFRHPSSRIEWLDDQLPHLDQLRSKGPFDLVTLCAVWQHLPDSDRELAFPNLASILTENGRLVMSLRHGPGGAGRRVFPVNAEATVKLAEELGLRVIRQSQAPSVQPGNRALGVSWTWLVFEKAR
ncbi:MAG: class I SAM-dependent methyltransferase [Porphyrobacter sp.]|nr:class I SAM-dependent methyltransferase [Porphyrobacter sp.]